MAVKAGIRLIDGCSSAPVLVQADVTRLRQVLVNLLSNAIKYNRPGGQVLLGVQSLPVVHGKGRRCRISVRDTGQGLTAKQRARLFQPFERLGAETRGIEGTGIGLVLTRQLVEIMGGRIEVTSEPGQGSTFAVDLPLATMTWPAESDEPKETQARGREGCAAGLTGRVLYVEDNPGNQVVMRQFIKKRTGLTLTLADSGETALDLLRDQAPEELPRLVLLDINLPGLDGFETFKALRQLPGMAGIPAIAISADAVPERVEQGLAAGFAAYLTKPLDLAALEAALCKFCCDSAGRPVA
jgi:CheY-like chemotaxis protein